MKKILILIALFLCGFACGGGGKAPGGSQSTSATEAKNTARMEKSSVSPTLAGNGDGTAEAAKPQPDIRKIIKHGQLSIDSYDVDAAADMVRSYADGANIYITQDELRNSYGSNEVVITIRVVNSRFDSLMANICKLGTVKNKSVSRDDVTEDYIDISARMNSKKVLEERYLELLKQAKKMEDILQIEKSINEVREEIESAEGKLRYYDNRVEYSTIELTIFHNSEIPREDKGNYAMRLWQAISNGFYGLADGVINILSVWHILVFIGLFIFIIFRVVKYASKKPAPKKNVPPPSREKKEE